MTRYYYWHYELLNSDYLGKITGDKSKGYTVTPCYKKVWPITFYSPMEFKSVGGFNAQGTLCDENGEPKVK